MSTYSANIITENGEQFIPASQRPDGTWRKARRVKDGYVPQEEVPLYESKGKQFSKKLEPVSLPSGQVAQRPIPGLFIIETNEKSATKKKHKKKLDEVTNQLEAIKLKPQKAQSKKPEKEYKKPEKPAQSSTNELAKSVDATATDPQKKLKNLKKRLREVEALEEKLKNGLISKPEPEQLSKVKRKNDLLMQIHELEKQVQVKGE